MAVLHTLQPDAEETAIARAGTHVLCNKFLVMVGPNVRISFMEQFGQGTTAFFRTGIVCSHEDAIALYKILQSTLAEVEKQIEAMRSAATQNV